MNPSDWQGEVFDPENTRFLSFLPEDDRDEAHCVRHEREMRRFIPLVHHAGALYLPADNFAGYTCEACLGEMFSELNQSTPAAGADPTDLLRSGVQQFFETWDDGEAPGNWFVYLCEETRDDIEAEKKYVWVTESHEEARELAADES